MSGIMRITDGQIDGVTTRIISGLYIFAINDVPTPTHQDPRIVFLRAIAREKECTGHLGTITLNDICRSYEKTDEFLFTKYRSDEFVATCCGVDEGDFYKFKSKEVPGGFIVPSIDARFWQLGSPDEDGDDMEYVMRRGAAALYVDPLPQLSYAALLAPNIATVSNGYRVEPSVWMERVFGNFQTAVVVGHDGVTLDAYANDLNDLAYLEIGIAEAEQAVLNHPWFQENAENLIWDDFDECLKIPKP